MKQSIGDFLLRRLQEVGIRHLFGVPGDYNLGLMQQLEDRGEPAWIGNCNELNASYATDAYARINGIGAMIVTHGVGTLSAVNGIAGAYSEHVPVILISGSLPLRAIQRGDLMHHTLVDREKGNLSRIFAEITEAQARLTPENAVAEIDRLILTAWRRKRPVYLELPSDIPYLEIEAPDSPLKLEVMPSEQQSLKACTAMILKRLQSAKSPAFLLDIDYQYGYAKPIASSARECNAVLFRVVKTDERDSAADQSLKRLLDVFLRRTTDGRTVVAKMKDAQWIHLRALSSMRGDL
jgi:indolepyruvate decarboxylase